MKQNSKLLYIALGALVVLFTVSAVGYTTLNALAGDYFIPLWSSGTQDEIVGDTNATSSSSIREPAVDDPTSVPELSYIITREVGTPTPTPSNDNGSAPIDISPEHAQYSEVIDMAPDAPLTEKATLVFDDRQEGLKAIFALPEAINAVVDEQGRELLVNIIKPEASIGKTQVEREIVSATPTPLRETIDWTPINPSPEQIERPDYEVIDLAPELELQDKYSILGHRIDGSMVAILMSEEMMSSNLIEEELKKAEAVLVAVEQPESQWLNSVNSNLASPYEPESGESVIVIDPLPITDLSELLEQAP